MSGVIKINVESLERLLRDYKEAEKHLEEAMLFLRDIEREIKVWLPSP